MSDVTFPAQIIRVKNAKATIPARPKSQRYRRWAILLGMDGKTVSEYYKACREAGVPCTKNNPVMAMAKGLITLDPPAETADKAEQPSK